MRFRHLSSIVKVFGIFVPQIVKPYFTTKQGLDFPEKSVHSVKRSSRLG